MGFNVIVDPGKKLQDKLKKLQRKSDDLTIPLTLITKDWFKSNRAIFALTGPGKYEDLSDGYKKSKRRDVGFVYPILRRSGDLERSLTLPGDKSSIAQIINKKVLILGTSDRTAVFHQAGTKKMPSRPPVLLGAEQVSPPGINRRTEAWVKILEDYFTQMLGKE